ncbi:MAG: DUF4012 domain-containing protein [Candidatus Levybacteria bacterium]|nr:DUF4012 domain-containing protein [Candidatus Levybacteria bacterium]
MNIPVQIPGEKKHEYPILIVDKLGILGQAIARQVSQESLVIFVSSNKVEEENIIHIPYFKKIPTIPDNTYSHIFIIDEYGTITKEFISSFIAKAKHDGSVLTLSININLITEDNIYNYISSYDKTKVVVTGDIFSKDVIFDKDTYINKFIKSAVEDKRIDIPNEGEVLTIPVYFDDVVDGILQAGFIEKEDKRIFFAYPLHKPSLLSLAHMFQKIEPSLKIDFLKNAKEKKQKLELSAEGKYLLDENYDLESKIKKIDLAKNKTEDVPREEAGARDFGKFKFGYLFFGVILTLMLFFILPLIATFSFLTAGAFFSKDLISAIENQNLDKARSSAASANTFFSLTKSSFALLEKEAQVLGVEERLSDFSQKIDQGVELSYTASKLLEGFDKIKNLNTSPLVSEEEFLKVTDDFKNALVTYQKQKNLGNIPKSIDQRLSDLVLFSSSTIDLWGELLGFDGEKKYLVLFQNNMELRPGGGFIGSFALLKIDSGKIKDFKILDVYDADGQLKGHVEPPFGIRRYLPSVHWYLRDSNFDVDFSKGALASAVFLNSELKERVDGVIGVDLSFVKNLLLATGPVKVIDFNETVDFENLFRITNAHVEKDFFPGSTQKKDFLRSLNNAIAQKLGNDKSISYLNVLDAFTKSLFEKHIVFAFSNSSLQSAFSVNGFGSTLTDSRVVNKTTVNDFLGINEANLTANKVNFYITRNISQNVTVAKDGSVSESVKISIKNDADKSLGKNGFYKNYLRVILPQGSILTSISIDGSKQRIVDAIKDPVLYEAKNFVPPTGLEVEKVDQGGKTIYGFLLSVDAKTLKTVEVNYSLSQKLDLTKNDFSYDLKLFKQPGVDNFPYSFSLTLPENLTAIKLFQNAASEGNKIIFANDATKDLELNLTLAKQ